MVKKQHRLVAAVFLSTLLVCWPGGGPRSVKASEQTDEVTAVKPARLAVHLYFADVTRQYLKAEERAVTTQGEPMIEKARAVAEALLEGPRSSLGRTVPEGVRLLALHVTGDGVAYIDLDRRITEAHPKGTSSELLSVFSIVNTLALNFSEIRAVKILIEGREQKTLAGHVALQFPFEPNLLIIK